MKFCVKNVSRVSTRGCIFFPCDIILYSFSYRIEHALDDCKKDDVISGRRCAACIRVISAIDVHRRAIESVFSHRVIQDLNIVHTFLQI